MLVERYPDYFIINLDKVMSKHFNYYIVIMSFHQYYLYCYYPLSNYYFINSFQYVLVYLCLALRQNESSFTLCYSIEILYYNAINNKLKTHHQPLTIFLT